jgi:uncharacterized protein (DUF2147 family)
MTRSIPSTTQSGQHGSHLDWANGHESTGKPPRRWSIDQPHGVASGRDGSSVTSAAVIRMTRLKHLLFPRVSRKGVWAWLGLFLVLLAPAELLGQAPVASTPVGSWRTFDDRTGLERGLVAIEERAGVLTGRIVGIRNASEATRTCEACTDWRKDQPILGMTIMTGMRAAGAGWGGGEILDPQTGSIYRCFMRLEDGGAKLIIRGYIGVSLFGRSQTWLRQPG